MSFSTHHINYLERSFLDELSTIQASNISWGQIAASQSLETFRINSIPRSTTIKNEEYLRRVEIYRMANLLAGVHGVQNSLVYTVVAWETEVRLFMGVGSQSSTSDESVLSTLLSSTYPGIELNSIPVPANLWSSLNQFPYGAMITGTPTVQNQLKQAPDQQIDRLIRALYGKYWAYIVIATPVHLSDIQTLSSQTLNELRLIINAEQSARMINPIAEKYKQLLNRFWSKIQSGKSQGMWHSIGYLLAESPQTLNQAKAIAKA